MNMQGFEILDANEIKLYAERRLAIVLKDALKNAGARGLAVGGVPQENPTLSDLGIDEKTSARSQKLAVRISRSLHRRHFNGSRRAVVASNHASRGMNHAGSIRSYSFGETECMKDLVVVRLFGVAA